MSNHRSGARYAYWPAHQPGLLRDRDNLLLEAAGIGRETFEVAPAFLTDPVLERSYTVARILALA